MDLWPIASSLCCIHFGLLELFKFLKYLLVTIGTNFFSRSSSEITNLLGLLKVPLTLLIFNGFNSPNPAEARSLAIPLTPRQSALFGVIPIVITGSFSPDHSKKLVPISAF